jgi:hypothetical protein
MTTDTPSVLSNLPDEKQTFLLKASISSGQDVYKNWQKWSASVDLNDVDGASFRLIPLLHKNLEKHQIYPIEMGKLKGISRYHWCKNQILLKAMGELLILFKVNTIDTMLLKGGALIYKYHNSPSLRPMSDFDLMVPRDQIYKATTVMIQNGWKSASNLMLDDPKVQKNTHNQSFVDKNGNECDLHWTPLREATWQDAERHFWETAEEITIHGNTVKILGPTEQLLHTIVHGSHYNVLPPIRWISDSWVIIENEKDTIVWERLIELGKKYSCLMSLQYGLQYLATEFKMAIPPDFLNHLAHQEIPLQEMVEYKIVSHMIPAYRIDTLLLRGWFRHCKQKPHASFYKKCISFPNFLRIYLRIGNPQDIANLIFKRLKSIRRESLSIKRVVHQTKK